MTLVRQSYETGTNGASLAVATDGQLVLTPPAGGTAVFSTTHPAHDSLSCKVDATGVQVVLGHTPGGSDVQGSSQVYFYTAAYPTSTTDILVFRNASANACKVQLDSTGHIVVVNAASASLNTSSSTVPLNAQWRLDVRCKPGTGTGDGELHVAVYNADTTSSPIYTYDSTTMNAGTAALASARAGKLTTTGDWSVWIDDFAINLGATAFIAPATSGSGSGATIVMQDDFTGTTSSTFINDSTYANLAGTPPTYVRNSHNGKSLRFVSGGQGIVEETFSSTTAKRIFSRIYRVPSLPTATAEVAQVRVGLSRGPAVAFVAGGQVRLLRTDGSSAITSANTIPVNTDFRLTFTVDPTALTITCAFFADTSSTTPVETINSSIPASIGMTAFRDGIVSAGALGTNVWLDVSWPIDTTDTDPGPRVYPVYPTVAPQANAGPDQTGVEPWSDISLVGTDVQETNPITSRTWTRVSGPTVTLALSNGGSTVSFIAAPALTTTTLTLRYSVSASDGTTNDDVILTILPATEAYLNNTGTWKPLRITPL